MSTFLTNPNKVTGVGQLAGDHFEPDELEELPEQGIWQSAAPPERPNPVATHPVPTVPESIEELGVQPSMIEQLILKFLYFRGELIGRDLGSLLGLQFSLIDEVLETLKRQHFIGVKKSLGMGNMSAIFVLADTGRNLTREYLDNNQYVGPVPVPLQQYIDMVERQKLPENWLTPATLKKAFDH